MYLKSIEVHGFKSFANKINFKFNDGITAIVGPNGSGKSNVADAVRWVLGEQSAKQLRGSKMEDVIFSGTQARKPMGVASVAITFDNSDHALNIDYEEVTVARRVYRSGESEYLLNGSNCRLRDVQELFFDTGIGKEGYSIIGQGQIDKILSGKPEERRELFDEAAGIVKYKKRKAAAEKELAEESQNLSRITDILSEIEKQVGPLEKQSETAREYLRLRDNLKNFEMNLFIADFEKNTQTRDENDSRIKIINNDLEDSKRDYEQIKLEYEKLENEIAEISEAIDNNREEKNSLLLENEKQEGRIALIEERRKALVKTAELSAERKEAVKAEILKKQEDIKKQENDREEATKKQDSLSDSTDDFQAEIRIIEARIAENNKEAGRRNDFLLGISNDDASLKADMSRLDTLLEQNAIKKAELAKKILSQKSFETEYESAVETYTKELDEVKARIDDINLETGVKEQESLKLKERMDETQGFLDKFEKEKIELESKSKTLQGFSERYEGYGNATRKVMERKQFEKGIIGVVADIIDVPEEYETAIETALGGNIQNIVTKDEATAKRMVQYLKTEKLGRTTFYPLDAITAKEANDGEAVLKEEGVIGYANKLIKYEKTYTELFKYLIGRIIVVDNMDNALRIARKFNYSLRMVTLEGEQLNPGGSISGGAFKNNSNLLGRKREIEESEAKAKAILVKVNALSRERDSFKEKRDRLKGELTRLYAELQKLKLNENTLQMKLQKEEERMAESRKSYSVAEVEIAELEVAVKDINDKKAVLEEKLSENNSFRQKANDEIAEINEKIENDRKLIAEVNERGAKVNAEFAALQRSFEFIEENITRLNEEIEKLHEEETNIDSQAGNLQSENEAMDKEIAEIRKEIAVNTEQCEAITGEITELEDKKAVITKNNREFFTKREELSEKIALLDKEAYRLNGAQERLQEQIDESCAYMWNEYEVTVDTARAAKDESLGSYTSLKKSVSETKNSIKALGSVNVNAIEEYKEVSERHVLYTNQRNDIIAAEDKLKGIITTLEEEMRKQFNDKFELIKVEFDRVFKEMFGGGLGTLELMEDEDVLTAGIKINAQPPGKKLQNMVLLSGGERALTAIALLFAIQNLKPSPFCLLDEIEAALDDSNVGRYANYLHKLTDHTQFIVITHRRGTMAAADALYGITMQEKGVSALVSVSLIDSQLSN